MPRHNSILAAALLMCAAPFMYQPDRPAIRRSAPERWEESRRIEGKCSAHRRKKLRNAKGRKAEQARG